MLLLQISHFSIVRNRPREVGDNTLQLELSILEDRKTSYVSCCSNVNRLLLAAEENSIFKNALAEEIGIWKIEKKNAIAEMTLLTQKSTQTEQGKTSFRCHENLFPIVLNNLVTEIAATQDPCDFVAFEQSSKGQKKTIWFGYSDQ
ncbi:hypothetical protein RB195_020056 [Necator americanus]|uniref:Uncharacterized protein n=1 Tax=Necator americanus TaxID=51031 RepID=A0ABR1CJE6_NECAM